MDDGEELLQYLRGEGKFTQDETWLDLILLDLNMPRKDGRDALGELKNDPLLKLIPVVIFTTSSEEQDKVIGYRLGAASYLTKPVSFQELVDCMKALGRYWVEYVELPDLSCLTAE